MLFKRLPFFADQVPNPVKRDQFLKMTQRAQPFIVDFKDDIERWAGTSRFEKISLDLPFDTCFFEAPGDESLMGLTFDGEHYSFNGILITDADPKKVMIIFRKCMGPDSIMVSSYESFQYTANQDGQMIVNCVMQWLKRLIDSFHANELLEGSTTDEIRMKSKGSVINRPVGKIIYLATRKALKSNKKSLSHIKFSHRFLRRGHWRILGDNKIGKNRKGDYCERGRTWVNNCEVGGKDLPLIRKTRVIG
jgi:hypothetical protein